MEDYPSLRDKFIEKYKDFYASLNLIDDLKKAIAEYVELVAPSFETWPEDVQKSYILLELTRNRTACDDLIEMLENYSNRQLAIDLKHYNTSPGFHGVQVYGVNPSIDVENVRITDIQDYTSKNYAMWKQTRGRAIIYNNLKNLKRVKMAQNESERFESVFTQLNFKVDKPKFDMTCDQIKDDLNQVIVDLEAAKNSGAPHQAIIVMMISHGQDEQVMGTDHPFCEGNNPDDKCFFVEFIKLFEAYKHEIVKLFFFNCCRGKDFRGYLSNRPGRPKVYTDNRKLLFFNSNLYRLTGLEKSKRVEVTDAFVYYSCAEGDKTDDDGLYCTYARILSESIAQYACARDMVEIMNKTVEQLANHYVFKGPPNTTTEGVRFKLFFNPGAYKKNKDARWITKK